MKINVNVTFENGETASVTIGQKDMILAEQTGKGFNLESMGGIWQMTFYAMKRTGLTTGGYEAWFQSIDSIDVDEADSEPDPTQ